MGHGERRGWAVAVFGDDEVGFAGTGRAFLVGVLAVQEDDEIGVVLQGAGVAQVADQGQLVDALFGAAVEGRDGDDGDLEFFGQMLEATGDLGDLFVAGSEGTGEIAVTETLTPPVTGLLPDSPLAVLFDILATTARISQDEERDGAETAAADHVYRAYSDEGWLGEVEGLSTSLAAAEEKIAQLDTRQERRDSAVFLGIPTLDQIAARTGDVKTV